MRCLSCFVSLRCFTHLRCFACLRCLGCLNWFGCFRCLAHWSYFACFRVTLVAWGAWIEIWNLWEFRSTTWWWTKSWPKKNNTEKWWNNKVIVNFIFRIPFFQIYAFSCWFPGGICSHLPVVFSIPNKWIIRKCP